MKSRSLDTNVHPTKLAVHDYPRTISKLKPKIHIIHIIAPEIIKTDVQNFRELVQKLTGKPVELEGSTKKADNASSQVLLQKLYGSKLETNTESAGVPILQDTQTMKKKIEEIYEGDNSNAFLSFFADVDGFLQDINEFPLLSLGSSQINIYREMPLY